MDMPVAEDSKYMVLAYSPRLGVGHTESFPIDIYGPKIRKLAFVGKHYPYNDSLL